MSLHTCYCLRCPRYVIMRSQLNLFTYTLLPPVCLCGWIKTFTFLNVSLSIVSWDTCACWLEVQRFLLLVGWLVGFYSYFWGASGVCFEIGILPCSCQFWFRITTQSLEDLSFSEREGPSLFTFNKGCSRHRKPLDRELKAVLAAWTDLKVLPMLRNKSLEKVLKQNKIYWGEGKSQVHVFF